MPKKKTFYRDSRGRFVSKNSQSTDVYKWYGKHKEQVYSKEKGRLQTRNVLDYRARRDKFNTRNDNQERKVRIIEDGDLKTILQRQQEFQSKKLDRSTDEKFVFSEQALKKYGLDEETQREYYEILKRANTKVEELQEITDDVLGARFSYNMNVDQDTLQRRLNAANKIFDENYIHDVAEKYKEDFFDAFDNFINQSDMYRMTSEGLQEVGTQEYIRALKKRNPDLSNEEIKKLAEAGQPVGDIKNLMDILHELVNEIGDYNFMKLRKKTKTDSLAYALNSIVDTFGYQQVVNELEEIVGYIRSGKGQFY